ncbi:RING finger and transmembrane domain-containing protein 1-like protein [Anopheles sinensis]|uniref:RING finger and transmembrane domain-containing protein 1-like protein n=1 Tax=Anopheles sinensis TaxID=74873 RepID=A0A084W4Y6_ANOSI|nr:RING finger and transmembrane domain-containing protein 1-like protein [Anopheles sinensis]
MGHFILGVHSSGAVGVRSVLPLRSTAGGVIIVIIVIVAASTDPPKSALEKPNPRSNVDAVCANEFGRYHPRYRSLSVSLLRSVGSERRLFRKQPRTVLKQKS